MAPINPPTKPAAVPVEPVGSSTTERMMWVGVVSILLVVICGVVISIFATEQLGAMSSVLLGAVSALAALVGVPATARQGRKAAQGWKPGGPDA